MLSSHLWIPLTLVAAFGQTLRNTLQRGLIAEVGTVGATHVRFLYGLPFGILLCVVVFSATGTKPFVPSLSFFAWTALGGVAQALATGLMLAAMRTKTFLVAIAYTKAEPIEIAILAMLVLGEVPTPWLVGAILVATAGVMIMSWPKQGTTEGTLRPAALGIASGGLFGLSSVGFKGGIIASGLGFLPAASITLMTGLAIQTVLLSLYLIATDRGALSKLLKAWRVSMPAGAIGAGASQLWFFAFALEPVAHVRTLGLVEILFSAAVSRTLMKQMASPREIFGIVLLLVGVIGVLNG